jgi:hypothetical protein
VVVIFTAVLLGAVAAVIGAFGIGI